MDSLDRLRRAIKQLHNQRTRDGKFEYEVASGFVHIFVWTL